MVARTEDLMGGTLIPNAAIDILAIGATPNDEELVIDQLRGIGIAAHPHSVTREKDLIGALDNGPHDIVLFFCGNEHLSLSRALALCTNYQPLLPFVVIHEEDESDMLVSAMGQGVRDVVHKNHHERLKLVITREYGDACIRRQLAKLRDQLRHTEDRCTALVENSQDAIAYVHEGMHLLANPAYISLFGYLMLEDIESVTLMDLIPPEQQPKLKALLRTLDQGADIQVLDTSCIRNDGTSFDAVLELSPSVVDGESCIQIIVREQTYGDERLAVAQTPHLRDLQTGLRNRAFFLQRLNETMGADPEPNAKVSVLYVMIDDFQSLQGAGPEVEDTILDGIARILEQRVAERNHLARFGDHSFTILSREADNESTENLAGAICSAVKEHTFDRMPSPRHVTCSIGIANAEDAQSPQDLVDQAFVACEVARAILGGNQYAAYNAGLETESHPGKGLPRAADEQRSETNIAQLLNNALVHNRLQLAYQPVVSLVGDSRETYDTLFRLQEADGEETISSHLLSSIKDSEQAITLDRWLIRHAIARLAKQRQKGRKINFFVPISAHSLTDNSLLLWICDCLRDHQAKGAWIILQIDAADLKNHLAEASRLFEGLNKLKCQIAVSNVSESLALDTLLTELAVDYAKLSPSVIQQLTLSKKKRESLYRISKKMHAEGIKVIASGIEDSDGLATLWQANVNYVQGYFLHPPSKSIDRQKSTNG